MATVLKSSSFRGMKAADIEAVINKARASAVVVSVPARIEELKKDIAVFEAHHKISTSEMLRGVCDGKIQETGEIEQWLIKYNTLCVHEQAKAK